MMDHYFSKEMQEANAIIKHAKSTSLTENEKEKKAVELANLLLREASRVQTREEKQTGAELARMMDDPKGKFFTMSFTDECFRSHRSPRIAEQLHYLLEKFGIPRYLSKVKQFELFLFKIFGRAFSYVLVPLVKWTLRHTTSRVILPGEKSALSHHLKVRRKEGVRLNLNHLGEAILSEDEAERRLALYLRDLKQPDIDYVSIKISTIYSQINILDWEKTIEVLSDRLKQLYRVAMTHFYVNPEGIKKVKFVNLDMEEYRDLQVTKELFQKVLDEEEFLQFSAGIVLQAYVPDSFPIQKELTEWAMKRLAKGGAPIKIRIVKGANLAMEQFEASLRGWPQAPYKTKHEVDANYKQMVHYGCIPEHARAVHLGVASHNLFDICYAILLRAENRLEKEVHFEMLEGMADHIRRVVQRLTHDMLLYCPVATKQDFQSAIAYLIRRLDENTGAENFLRHSFGLRSGTEAWQQQVEFFSKACHDMTHISNEPRRTQDRSKPPEENLSLEDPFTNEADTDFSLLQNNDWAHKVAKDWQHRTFKPIPLVINGKEVHQEHHPSGKGVDPSHPHKGVLYHYAQASWEQVDECLNVAKAHESYWSGKSAHSRAEVLSYVAKKMREKRGDLIGVMMRDGGKTFVEADPEVSEAIDFAEYYLRSMLKMDACKDIKWKSKGTLLVAPPWNFPVSIPAGGICAALVTGNCVIFKPAPEAVLSGWVLVNLFWEAGVPKEVLQFINCEDEPIGSRLIADKRLNAVILTGGTSTARIFMKLRPDLDLAAETGGKNALIITGLSDRDLAIKDLINSAFGHSGQKCSAASLAVLEAEVYDDAHFRKQLKDAVESLPVGSPWHFSSKIIPLIREPNESLLRGLTTLDPGETWLVKPKQDPDNPLLWSPGVKLGVKEGSFMHQTELFGPVLAVMRANNLDHALKLANGTSYGLTSGIHSLDDREQKKWLNKIEAGNLYINRGITGAIVRRQPFGGCKASSFGRGSKAGGPNYISEFMRATQVALPQEKHPVSETVNELTSLIQKIALPAEKLGIWFASISNYAYWAHKFSHDHDPSKIVGQDNFLRYAPQTNLTFRIQKEDEPLDLFRILAAALSCGVKLTVSYDANECPVAIGPHWKKIMPTFTFIEEDEKRFISRLGKNECMRVRLISKPPHHMREAAAGTSCYLSTVPVLASGRFELLNFLAERAVSIDYHRYGNLGQREGEARTPVL
ncbi:MAG TPA: proline dehydrogenase family protein [Rhabdochlamydiaceae bacterium]|nr:proline dehydrogenase family protein [Rhabdochlamydiaceae bacterium]